MTLKLGKTPARPGAVTFKLAKYIDTTKLPKPPRHFGHENLFESATGWGMLGNDRYGDCVLAGAAHETMLWNAEASKAVGFTDTAVLQAYTEITGFNPDDPNTDNGTDMQTAASYRRKTGIPDAFGNRHRIAAYLAIQPGNIREHYQALWLFGAIGIGIRFPASAFDQFNNNNRPWSVVRNSPIEGGHYLALCAKRTHLECITWGKIQPLTVSFLQAYEDEALAYVSLEALTNNVSPEGFDATTLLADLNALPVA